MKKKKGFYIGIGLMIRTLIGFSYGNIGLWLLLWLLFLLKTVNNQIKVNKQ